MSEYPCLCGAHHAREFWSPQAQEELRLGKLKSLPAFRCYDAIRILRQREEAIARINERQIARKAA